MIYLGVVISLVMAIGLLFWFGLIWKVKSLPVKKETPKIESPLKTDNDVIKMEKLMSFLDSDEYSVIFENAKNGSEEDQLKLGKLFYENADYQHEPMNKVCYKQSLLWFNQASEQGSQAAHTFIERVESKDEDFQKKKIEKTKEEKKIIDSIEGIVTGNDVEENNIGIRF